MLVPATPGMDRVAGRGREQHGTVKGLRQELMRKGSGGGRKEKARPDVKKHLTPNCQKQTAKEVSNFLLGRCLKADVSRSPGLRSSGGPGRGMGRMSGRPQRSQRICAVGEMMARGGLR